MAQNLSTRSQIEERLGLAPSPKKPLTPYFQFMRDARPRMLRENPKLSAIEVVKQLAEQWKTVDEGTKQKLADVYKQEKSDWIQKRAQYESTLTQDQKYEIQNAKAEIQESKEKRAYKKVNNRITM